MCPLSAGSPSSSCCSDLEVWVCGRSSLHPSSSKFPAERLGSLSVLCRSMSIGSLARLPLEQTGRSPPGDVRVLSIDARANAADAINAAESRADDDADVIFGPIELDAAGAFDAADANSTCSQTSPLLICANFTTPMFLLMHALPSDCAMQHKFRQILGVHMSITSLGPFFSAYACMPAFALIRRSVFGVEVL